MMQDEIFTTVDLPVAGKATILEGKGRHYFEAMKMAKGDGNLLIKYLMMQLVLINNICLTEDQINEMHLRDITYISVVIGTMMSNEFTGGF